MKRREFLKNASLLTLALCGASNAASLEQKMIKLNNGLSMPLLGLGMWDLRGGECESVVLDALSVGYRSFDSAQMYGNEAELSSAINTAIKAGQIKREEVFLTTKIVASSYDEAKRKIDESVGVFEPYIDLVLIHWPRGNNIEVYKALEDSVKSGKVKSIGISNFYGDELDEIIKNAKILPVLNQCQTHIYQQNTELRKTLAKHNIILESYSPFGGAKNVKEVLANPLLNEIAKAHGKTPAQIVLAWLRAENIIAIPKTSKLSRLKENFASLEITLSDKQIEQIRSLDAKQNMRLW